MIHVRDVYYDLNCKENFRIIAILGKQAYTISLNNKKNTEQPKAFWLEDLEAKKKQQLLIPVADPYETFQDEGELSEEVKKIRDKRWETLSDLWNDKSKQALLLNKKDRHFLLDKLQEELEVSPVSIRRILTKFWRKGMRPNSLTPEYKPAKKEEQKSGAKRGSKSRYDSNAGIGISEKERGYFQKAYKKYHLGQNKTIETTYLCMLEDYYTEEKTVDGKKQRVYRDESKLPTRRQFRYWVSKHRDREEEIRCIKGDKVYENDFEPVYASTQGQVFGVGDLFELDATTLPVEIYEDYEGEFFKLGKPLLFLSVDVYSRMVTGYTLTLEPESWRTAALTILNSTKNKVAFCQEYNISIEPEDWPCHFLPAGFLADNGPFKSKNTKALLNNYGVRLSYTTSYQGRDKPNVERRHGDIKYLIQEHLINAVKDENRKKGKRIESELPCISMFQLNQFIIQSILEFNRKVIDGYVPEPGMLACGMLASPCELWSWSEKKGHSNLQAVTDEECLRKTLLPQKKRVIGKKGIRLNNFRYSSSSPKIRKILRNHIGEEVTVFYDPLYAGEIYVSLESQIINLDLNDKYSKYHHMSFKEASILYEHQKCLASERQREQDLNRISQNRQYRELAETVKEQTKNSSARASRLDKKARRQQAIEKAQQKEKESHMSQAEPEKINPHRSQAQRKNSELLRISDYLSKLIEEEDE